MSTGGSEVFEIAIPDDAPIDGDVAVATFIVNINPAIPAALLVEIADVDEHGSRRALWGYFLHVIDGDIIIDDHLPDFLIERLESKVDV